MKIDTLEEKIADIVWTMTEVEDIEVEAIKELGKLLQSELIKERKVLREKIEGMKTYNRPEEDLTRIYIGSERKAYDTALSDVENLVK